MTASRTLVGFVVGLAALIAAASATKCIRLKYSDRCDLQTITKTYAKSGPMVGSQVTNAHRSFYTQELRGMIEAQHQHFVIRPDLGKEGKVRVSMYSPYYAQCQDMYDNVVNEDVMCFEYATPTVFEGRECTKYYNTTDMVVYVAPDNEMIGVGSPEGYVTVKYNTTVKYTPQDFVEAHKGCAAEFAVPPSKKDFDAVCHNLTASRPRLGIIANSLRALKRASLLW